MAIDLPARHDKSSLNCRPGMCLDDTTSTSIVFVAAEDVNLAGIIVPRRAEYRTFFCQTPNTTYRFRRSCLVPGALELRRW